ncbi:alpha/beta fold hydrolase, partial [Actinomyces oricola]
MTALGRICIILIVIATMVGIYAYRNMTYDRRALQQIQKARVTEKQAVLPDGSVLNFGEGPDEAKKPPLLLLHGQNVSWEDYAPVLPALVKEYHVYAVDCYGHGG